MDIAGISRLIAVHGLALSNKQAPGHLAGGVPLPTHSSSGRFSRCRPPRPFPATRRPSGCHKRRIDLIQSIDDAEAWRQELPVDVLQEILVDGYIGIRSVNLDYPGDDPADRLIIATAWAGGHQLVIGNRRPATPRLAGPTGPHPGYGLSLSVLTPPNSTAAASGPADPAASRRIG